MKVIYCILLISFVGCSKYCAVENRLAKIGKVLDIKEVNIACQFQDGPTVQVNALPMVLSAGIEFMNVVFLFVGLEQAILDMKCDGGKVSFENNIVSLRSCRIDERKIWADIDVRVGGFTTFNILRMIVERGEGNLKNSYSIANSTILSKFVKESNYLKISNLNYLKEKSFMNITSQEIVRLQGIQVKMDRKEKVLSFLIEGTGSIKKFYPLTASGYFVNILSGAYSIDLDPQSRSIVESVSGSFSITSPCFCGSVEVETTKKIDVDIIAFGGGTMCGFEDGEISMNGKKIKIQPSTFITENKDLFYCDELISLCNFLE